MAEPPTRGRQIGKASTDRPSAPPACCAVLLTPDTIPLSIGDAPAIARMIMDGTVTPLRIPHATGEVEMLGTTRHRLVLEHTVTCSVGMVRGEISHFDPVTGTDRPVALLPVDEQYGGILRLGAQHAVMP